MFGFLKKLGRKSEPTTPVPPPAPAVKTPSAPAPAARPTTPVVPKAAPPQSPSAPAKAPVVAKAPTPTPTTPASAPVAPKAPTPAAVAMPKAAAPAAPIAVSKPAPPAEPEYSKETIDIPLKQIWSGLDPAIAQSAFSQPDKSAMLRLPLNFLQNQLAKGVVKLDYARLRQFSPDGLFGPTPSKEGIETTIPIGEILPRLKPEHISRRSGQKKVEVPDDIEPIFGDKAAQKLRISQPEPKPAPGTTAKAATAAPAIKPASPEPAEAPAPIRLSAPIAPIAAPAAAEPAAPAPAQAPAEAPIEESGPIKAPKLDPSLASLKPKPASEEVFTLSLMDVAAFWTENGKTELANLYRHSLEIPVATLQAALKAGKLQFKWREVRQWVHLAPGNTLPTINDDLAVELPLNLVAPRAMEFFARNRPKKKAEVGEDIPDVFFKKAGAPSAQPAEAPKAAEPAKSGGIPQFGEIFGQPDKQNWSFAEITQKTATLRGVTGAIIATSDGLLVAGSWPGGVKSDAVAGFVPQMYSRMLHYTKELKMGEPGNVTLVIDELPMQIFKTANSFFTVLGRSGEPLPKNQLNAIASRLAAKGTQN